MKKEELVRKIAESLNCNRPIDFFQYISNNCVYISDNVNSARGKKQVCDFLTSRMNAINRDHVASFAFVATVEKSNNPRIKAGSYCVPFSQFDKYNCVGIFSFETNIFGKIKEISFTTSPDIVFAIHSNDKRMYTSVPKDAHDAITYRAYAYNLTDSKKAFRIESNIEQKLSDTAKSVYQYIGNNLFEDFNSGIENAAGYMFMVGLSEEIRDKTGKALFIPSNNDAIKGIIPDVDEAYKQWMAESFNIGKKLFLGFIEYVNLREKKEFDKQLIQSYIDISILGAIKAKKDVESGAISAKITFTSKLTESIYNLSKRQSVENMKQFAMTINEFFETKTPIYLLCKKGGNGEDIKLAINRNKRFAAVYSSLDEIRLTENDEVMTMDFKRIIELVFHNKGIEGITFDPETFSLFTEKAFLLKCLLHGKYPEQNNGGTENRDWGFGIPVYSQNDLMTPGEIQNFAMHTLLDRGVIPKEFNLVSACDCPDAVPNFIFEFEGSFVFVLVKGYTTMDEPSLSEDEKEELLRICDSFNATCFWSPVGFLSMDPMRFKEQIALKGDGFYCKCTGLRKVE